MRDIESRGNIVGFPPSSEHTGLPPWPKIEYLFDVITKEGEKKPIRKLRLDPNSLGVYVTDYEVRRSLSSLEKTIESKNSLFKDYLTLLKEEHGTNPVYKEDLEMLEDAAAIVITPVYQSIGPPQLKLLKLKNSLYYRQVFRQIQDHVNGTVVR